MKTLSSELISGVDYDVKTRTLTVQFARNGATYTYTDVPAYHYTGLLDAGSPGRYFTKNIRNNFPATKQEPPSND